jgi:hypothetical protein
MRTKVVPPARGLEVLQAAQGALPLVPGSEADCCTRIRDRTEIPARDEAREWLTFLLALGLAAESERGFHRVRDPPEEGALGQAFRAEVFGVRELLAAMDEPLTDEAAFEAVRPAVPQWEHNHHTDWEAEWRERTARLLGWGVVFGVFRETDEGFVVAE